MLGAIYLLNFSWKEPTPLKVANCFAHAGFFRATVSNPHDDPHDDDWTCSDLYKAVHEIASQELEGDFETFALAAAPVVAPVTDAKISDTVGGPDENEEPVDEEPCELPTMVYTQEYLRRLASCNACNGLMQC